MLAAVRSSSALVRLAGAGAIGGGGCLVYYYASSERNSNSNHSKLATAQSEGQFGGFLITTVTADPSSSSEPTSSLPVVLPTLQATGRALNLARTAIMMAVDYKTADYSYSLERLLPWRSSEHDADKELERLHWEVETERRRIALEESQAVYSRRSHPHLNDYEKLEAKRHEKQLMHGAAVALAESEEQLAELGSHQSDVHRRAANRLLRLCQQNGGVYIKVGQHMANLDYLVPQEYIEVLAQLFDDNPQSSLADVRQVVREDFGADVDELFDDFEVEPIASASLAQVHVAYEKDRGGTGNRGRKLAVKVQHRGLRETSRGDIYALVAAVGAAERLFPEGFRWGWLADEIAPHLPLELDFRNEGRNAERAAADLAKNAGDLPCVIPSIVWDRTSERVLTMEFEEGFRATDAAAIEEAGLDKRVIAKLISSVFSSQIFLSAFVHCDPHPANVLLRANALTGNTEMVLVDHGLYRSLDRDFCLRYSALWEGLMLADLDGIKAACHSLGIDRAYTLFAAMLTARPFDEMIERSKKGTLHRTAGAGAGAGASSASTTTGSSSSNPASNRADQAVIRGYAQRFLHDIFDLLGTLPRQMLLLLKMNDCLRHIDYSLGSPTNTMVVCGRYAARAIYEDAMRDTSRGWLDKARAWWGYVRVSWRIRVHDAVVWWIENSNNSNNLLRLNL